MEVILKYRGREVTETDVVAIRRLIEENAESSRRHLSKLLCEAWDWRQANGELRDMVCRSLMLELYRAGHIELPPVRRTTLNNATIRRRRRAVAIDRSPIEGRVKALGTLRIEQVRRTDDEPLFDSLLEEHHYLGYTRPVGEHLKHLVWAGERPIACFAWSSPPRHLRPRDRNVGWSAEARRRNARYIAYNTRFLILPWIRVPHLASHLLGRIARRIAADWEELYAHPVYYLETFVDPARFKGTCYRAANWVSLGLTTGRGHNATTHRATQPKKEVMGYPLVENFRELLSGE